MSTQALHTIFAPSAGSRWPRLLAFPFAIRSLARRWRGMIGMIIGVGVALSLVLALMGMIGSSMGQIIGDFPRSGANVYVSVNGGQLIPLQHGASSPGTIDGASAILSKLRSIRGVQGAIGVLSWSLEQQEEGRQARNRPTKYVPVLAVDGDPSDITNLLVMQEGRWLRRANEVVLGIGLAGTKSLHVGDSLRMNGQEFEVVGIGKIRGFGPTGDNLGYVDARALRQRGITGDIVNYVAVQTTAPQAVRSVAEDLSLRAASPDELIAEVVSSQDYESAMVLYWIIDLLILFVAGMFVSTMLARSVAERRTEFGTLRAIGVPTRTILVSVFGEALFIVLASYVVGFVFSVALGEAVNIWVARPLHYDHLYAIDPSAYFGVFLLTIAVGAIAGYFPARAATHVDPLEILREV